MLVWRHFIIRNLLKQIQINEKLLFHLGSWEFVIDFHTPTVDVPILADKKLYIDKQLSLSLIHI